MSYVERRLFCPRCGYEFDPIYSMVVFDARYEFLNKGRVRCPKCDYEFVASREKIDAVRSLSTRRLFHYH
jgi:uncharacterized Zn finger protein (UPF0148 family)